MSLRLDDFRQWAVRCYDEYYALRCPWHKDDHASLLVWDTQWFRCLACDVHGNWQTLHDRLMGHGAAVRPSTEGVSWAAPRLPTGIEQLERLSGTAHNILLERPGLGWYLKSRGIDELITTCQLGWIESWYSFPIFDPEWNQQGLVLRAGPHVEKVSGLRFVFPLDQKPMLYVPDWSRLQNVETLFVCFGIIDALSLLECGVASATSSGGKGSFQADWLSFWRKKVVILPDAGEEKEAIRLADDLHWRGTVGHLEYEEKDKDPNDILVHHGPGALRKQLTRWS